MAEWIQQFPITAGRLIRLQSPPDNTLRSYHFAATELEVPLLEPDESNPNANWFPFIGVRIEGKSIGRASNGSDVSVDCDVNRISVWLTRLSGSNEGGSPVDVEWQLRAASECTSEVISQGTIHLTDPKQIGLVVQAQGWLCTQFEFWCRVSNGEVPARVGIDIMVGRSESTSPGVYKGSVSV